MGTLRHWRRQAVFPKVRGFRRLRRPGSIGHVLCTDRWVPPTERAGSEGGIKYRGRQQAYCIPESKKGAPLRGRLYKRVVFAALRGQKSGCPLSASRFPPNTRHPERKRRISVRGVSDSWGSKYQSAGRHQTYSIPESKRVQAPSAPRFYRSCADALTDGFGPQSGLVQRGVINAACRPPPLVASPPPSPRRRWDNKAPRSCNLISCSKQSTGCCAPAQRGKGSAVRHQRGRSHRRWLTHCHVSVT